MDKIGCFCPVQVIYWTGLAKSTTMDNRETPPEYRDKFLLSFVEMGWAGPKKIDPRFTNWVTGRMEIFTYESEYNIGEKLFCTPYTDEWRDFQEKYDSEWVDKEELEKVTKTLKEKFYRLDKNYDPII